MTLVWNGLRIAVTLKRASSTKDIYVDAHGTEYEVWK